MAIEHELKRRDLYLNKLIAFQDTEPVKIITGIRRCGKSSLLELMRRHLEETGVEKSQIVAMNFESHAFRDLTSNQFYEYVKRRVLPNKRMYLFFDEVQRVEKWEDAVNSFRVDFDCDIYVTGSNAYLLSSEYSTYLSGRCVEIKMLPLSFSEFIFFHGFTLKETTNALGNANKLVIAQDGTSYSVNELFNAYMRYGGMPGIADVGLEQEKVSTLLDGLYSTVVVRDILERESRKGQKRIADPVLLRKITLFLADNIGCNISASSIGNTLISTGMLASEGKQGSPSAHTVLSYVRALLESYFFYEIKRFDIKGKEYLRSLGKYYIVDVGMRNFLLGYRNRDRGRVLENIVYFELLRRGYDVALGKVDDMEVDFVAANAKERVYIQVSETLQSAETREREFAPLRKIKDNYAKIVLSLDESDEFSSDGISSLNLIDWLLA